MIRENFDTLDTLLGRYVAGNLPLPAHVLVKSHLEMKTENHDRVRALESLAGMALEEMDGAELIDRSTMLSSIFGSSRPNFNRPDSSLTMSTSRVFPPALLEFIGNDAESLAWKTRLPGYREHDLGEIEGLHVHLFWIKPGRTMPAHTHEGSELSLVLTGAFSDVRGHYGRGDISVADDTLDHRPVADIGEPCIGFAVMDGSFKLTGSLGQRIRDLIG